MRGRIHDLRQVAEVPVHRGNPPAGMPWHPLHVRGIGKQVFQWLHQHHGRCLPVLRREGADGYQPQAEGCHALQSAFLYVQPAPGQRKYRSRHRRAVYVLDQPDLHRVYPKRHEACPEEGVSDHHRQPEHQWLPDAGGLRDDETAVFHPHPSVPL